MTARREDTFTDTPTSAVFTAVYENDKVTLYTVDSRVIKVHFHDTYHWKHLTSWNCTPCPDKCYLHLSNMELSRQLRALKEEVDTGDRNLMNIDGPLVFKFVHNTDDDARQMFAQNKKMGNTFKQFLQKIDSQVKYITMEATLGGTTEAVSQAASLPVNQDTVTTSIIGMSGSSTATDSIVNGQVNARDFYQGHTTNYAFSLLSLMFVTNDSSGNSACHTRWATIHKTGKHTLQPTISDFRRLWTRTKELFHASLEACWSGSMVFCFEHESREDAINMIIRHAEVKEVILHFLQELDPSIQDIRMEVELRDVSESEEQTSETRPGGMADPKHKDEEEASRSHPQQKDDDETYDPNIHLSHSQQGQGSGSHSSGYSSRSHSSGYTSSDPRLKPLVKGQDSDRRASSDWSQGPSRRRRDPRLSTASHVIHTGSGSSCIDVPVTCQHFEV
ncbi:uncharacterized protein [Haliotis cracherodii]|uniref:uncharacterized protein n=1 Tax=Haliotis cracherodii TaxID=6455 RepID=UPI0039EABE72